MLRPLSQSMPHATQALQAATGLRWGQLLLHWRPAVGPGLARHAAPARLQGETLHLVCSSSTWAQEVLLRQGPLLEALNSRLQGPPLRRLRCQVGPVPEPTDLLPDPREGRVRWESIPLPQEELERAHRLASAVRDPMLAERARRLILQLSRRRQRALQLGQRPCPGCQAPSERQPCPTCTRERQARLRAELLRRLGEAPWLTREQLRSDMPDLPQELFQRARLTLRSRLERDAWAGLRALPKGAPLPDPLRGLILELLTLVAQLPPHQLEARHLRASLPRSMAQAYLDDQALGPWTPDQPAAATRPPTTP